MSAPDVAAELRAVAARKGIAHAEIARRINRTPMWLSRRLSATTAQPMSVDDLARIAGALDVDPSDVLSDALAQLASDFVKQQQEGTSA